MGVIKKVIFRGQILSKPKHRNLFLDMEENIHIHFRDLRIEMGRPEFEEFAAVFLRQSGELGAIIRERNYEDGKLPNANQDDVRIWTESRLKNEVKYHPRRFSLEECGDGYHFHYRNYKLLLDREEFLQLAAVFASVDTSAGYARSHPEVLALLEENEVDFVLAEGNAPDETLSIAVAPYHIPKVKDVFRYIGFEAEGAGTLWTFRGEALTVKVRSSVGLVAQDFRRFRALSGVARLVDFLGSCSATVDANDINRIKCQVLDLYFTVLRGEGVTAETDPQLWLHAGQAGGVIFPYSARRRSGKQDAEELYRGWSALLSQFQFGFVKPRKNIYDPEAQARVGAQVEEALRREAAAFGCVTRVYLMGSAMRGELGRYQVPFVHGKLVKLGSDIDILVELDESLEGHLPSSWRLVNRQASNTCAVYHLGEIPLDGTQAASAVADYRNLNCVEHLLDAYVHFPSGGHTEEKDAFLRRFGAKLVFDRERDGAIHSSSELASIAEGLQQYYALPSLPAVERLAVSSGNRLYKVFSQGRVLVLKVFRVSGNYSSSRIEEHAAYESALIADLRARGVPTAAVVLPVLPEAWHIDGAPTMLYEWLPGELRKKPEYPVEDVAASLARLHAAQKGPASGLSEAFRFDETCMIWLPAFERYRTMQWDDAEIASAIAGLSVVAAWHHAGENRDMLYARSPSVHCHGDVTPKNVILGSEGPGFFDFNNAFFGPRMADVIDGAFEFSLAEQYFHLADFRRFDAFVSSYSAAAPANEAETQDLGRWIELIGIIKFAKELRVMLQKPSNESLRRSRALAIAAWVLGKRGAA